VGAVVDSAVAEVDSEAAGEWLEEEVLPQHSYMGRIHCHLLLQDSATVEKLGEAEV